MAVIYRNATPADRAAYIDFINMVFSVDHEPHDFKALLPKAFADGRGLDEIHAIAVDERGIRALVSLLPGRMKVLDAELNTGFVGSVSVHPYSRGEGHMKALMGFTLDKARDAGMDIMLLGGQRQRYEYFGFTAGGTRVDYSLSRTNLRHAAADVDIDGIDFIRMRDADASLIDRAYTLFCDSPIRAVRSREDFVIVLESWRCTPWIVLKDGAFAGYLSADAKFESIPEIKLAGVAMPAVLKAWYARNGIHEADFSFAEYDPASLEIAALAETFAIRACERLRVLNFPKVLGALLAVRASLGAQDGALSLRIDDEPLTLRIQGGVSSVERTAPQNAPRLSAMRAQECLLSPVADRRALDAPAGWLPLPFHFAHPDCF